MSETYNCLVTVVSQKGECGYHHKVGDSFLITGVTPPGVCLSAFAALLPHARALMFGGSYPWEEEGVAHVACPDHVNPVVFELRRVPK